MTGELECSPYLLRPLRGICQKCRERIAQPEVEVCRRCYDDAQAGIGEVVDLEDERRLREYERRMEGK